MINPALPCSCCGDKRIDFQSINKGKMIICEKCIRKPFRKGKVNKKTLCFCSFHRKWEKAFFTVVFLRVVWKIKRPIWVCSDGWSELFRSCRKDM